MKKMIPAVAAIFILSGCAGANKPASTTPSTDKSATPSVVTPTPASQPVRVSTAEGQTQDYASRMMQCRKELDALQMYSATKHQQLSAEFNRTAGQLKKYLEVKNNIGMDVNDLAMPKYQFAIRDVCFRIKTQLATSIVTAK
jgi:hypothetical protein